MTAAALRAILGRVPTWAWALALLLAWGAWQHHEATASGQRLREHDAATAAAREQAYRRAVTRQSEVMNEVFDQAAHARSDATAAGTALQRLRIRALAAERRASAAAAKASAPASAATGVPADVLSQCAERVRLLADYADQARIAGQACERSYEAAR